MRRWVWGTWREALFQFMTSWKITLEMQCLSTRGGWRCRHAIGFRHCLDKGPFSEPKLSPFQKAASVLVLPQFMMIFFSTAKDLGLRDHPDDLFSVPKGLINLKNSTRQLKPLPKTVIRSAFSTASFLCSCSRDGSAQRCSLTSNTATSNAAATGPRMGEWFRGLSSPPILSLLSSGVYIPR